MDFDFKTPQYDNSWLPVYYFSDYGNKEHYFLQLSYAINRNYYEPELYSPLDLNLKSADGEEIFADLSDAKRALFASRKYKLIKSSESPSSRNGDILYIIELYGYEPGITFHAYNDEMIASPSYVIPGGSGSSTIASGIPSRDQAYILITLSDAKLAASVRADGIFWVQGTGSIYPGLVYYDFKTPDSKIYGVSGNSIAVSDLPAYTSHGNTQLIHAFNGEWEGNLTFHYMGNVRKNRSQKATLRSDVVFQFSPPSREQMHSQMEVFDGVMWNYGSLCRLDGYSEPTDAEWREHMESGDYYVQEGTTVRFVDGMYQLTTKYAPYI